MENEKSAHRGTSFAACILPLHHPTVMYSYCQVLVTMETYGEICLPLGTPVWVFLTSACLRVQTQSTGEYGKRDAWARRKWFDTIATPSQGRPFTLATGYQPYQCSGPHSVQAEKPLRCSANHDQRNIVLSNVDEAEK